ncbi:MAG: hypothetical protein K1X64_20095, partial [Myxococcaceae bacterium]|nr:hypothetical protein [Myxococcaceae bacterium]
MSRLLVVAVVALSFCFTACNATSVDIQTGDARDWVTATLKCKKKDKKKKKKKSKKKKPKHNCPAGQEPDDDDVDAGTPPVKTDGGVSDAGVFVPAEQCNAIDDNDDGRVDEGFDCIAGTPVLCTLADGGTGLGDCSATCGLPSVAQCRGPVDSDGDGAADPVDLFPNDAAEQGDNDRDGIGNKADPDDDNDGILDVDDAHPMTAEVVVDLALPPVMLVGETRAFELVAGGLLAEEAELSLKSAPAGATYDAFNKQIVWTPAATDLGEKKFTVLARAGFARVEKTMRTVVARPLVGVSATIGPAGGALEMTDPASPGFGTKLVFPAGALSTSTVISVRPVESAGAQIDLAGYGASFGTALLLEPRGIKFQVPVDMTLPRNVSVDEEDLTLSAIEPGDWSGLRGEPEVTFEDDNRWHVQLSGFSIVSLVRGAPTMAANFAGSLVFNTGRPIDLVAQKSAAACSWRLQCEVQAKTTSTCAAYAAFNRCLWESYEDASAMTGDAFTPAQFLGSLYDLSVSSSNPYWWPGLGLEPTEGSRAARAPWLDQHDDADPATSPNNGFRVPYLNDPDRSGRKDHFATSARTLLTGALLTAAEPSLGMSKNDASTNWQGMKFGTQVALGILHDGPSIERAVKSTMCDVPSAPTPAFHDCGCGDKRGAQGCCEKDPLADQSLCEPRIDAVFSRVVTGKIDTVKCPLSPPGYYMATLTTAVGRNLRRDGRVPQVALYEKSTGWWNGVVQGWGDYAQCWDGPKPYSTNNEVVGYPRAWANPGTRVVRPELMLCQTTQQTGCGAFVRQNVESTMC